MRAGRDDLVVGPWGARFGNRRMACSHGRGGITDLKQEGDGATPLGNYRLQWLYWRADRRLCPMAEMPAEPLGLRQGWAETPGDPDYNRPILHPHSFPADRMRRGDGLYDICVVTDQNAACVPGDGSAIFVHLWRKPRHPTAGCVAFRRADLEWILHHWRPWSRLVVRAGGGL